MSLLLTDRLNQILPTITTTDFLSGKGLGNEIAFYIFDYDPEEELQIREHINFLLAQIPKTAPDLKVTHINLFDLILDYLKERKLLDKVLQMQQQKGDAAVQKALAAPLHASKLLPLFEKAAAPEENDLVLVSGVGNVYPLLRTHSLLNNLHPIMGQTPLVLFFPGKYDGQALKLFGSLQDDNYYRAFKLIP
ncbi:MAG: DUF1788 domain-containing protein [Gammaproteobacteria bacterium]|nr:DUF1788 domain-containing protein [Gammaproteobacteria bacterium]MBT5966429.1 DUF1788 domain-containing protein [Gammaproteobacteria bacterium]